MGAHNIEFEMIGAPNFSAIEKKFNDLRKENRDYNGHQEGYSGDFQTVREVKDHTHKVFNSYNEAHDYCMETAQKWDFVVAVRYRFVEKDKFKYSAKFDKLNAKCNELTLKLHELKLQPIKLAQFVTCEGCKSKVSSRHLHGMTCPVCGEGDFRPLGLQRKLKALKDKIDLMGKQLEALGLVEKTKAINKFGKVGTLVAGWGAS